MNAKHPVYIVDDDASIRRSLRFLLSTSGHNAIAFEDGESFLIAAPALEAGCVLLDVRLSGMDGLEVHRRLRALGLGFAVIILTGHGDVPMAVEAMRAGASDFVPKPFTRDDLLAAIGRAMARLDDDARIRLETGEARARLNILTPREREVMAGLARGLPNKAIADDLQISPRTVEVHRANLMHKLGVRSFPEALRIAFAAGLPDEEPPVPALP